MTLCLQSKHMERKPVFSGKTFGKLPFMKLLRVSMPGHWGGAQLGVWEEGAPLLVTPPSVLYDCDVAEVLGQWMPPFQ